MGGIVGESGHLDSGITTVSKCGFPLWASVARPINWRYQMGLRACLMTLHSWAGQELGAGMTFPGALLISRRRKNVLEWFAVCSQAHART